MRVSYLGKKGELTARLKSLGQLPGNERAAAGQEINRAKQEVQSRLNTRREAMESAALEAKLAADAVDVSLPGRGSSIGGRHPVSRAQARIERIFSNAGFGVRSGPEIEDEFHNFELEGKKGAQHLFLLRHPGDIVIRSRDLPDFELLVRVGV